jgi:hypothetical protein
MSVYRDRVTMEELYESRRSAEGYIAAVVENLWETSGGIHVPRTARMVRVDRDEIRAIEFSVHFDSRAWTG